MSKVFQILCLILVLTIDTIKCKDVECQDSKQFDRTVTDYFMFASIDSKYPTNQKELQSFCK